MNWRMEIDNEDDDGDESKKCWYCCPCLLDNRSARKFRFWRRKQKKKSNLFQVCTRKNVLPSGHCLQRPPLPPPPRVFVNKSNNLDDSSSRKAKREKNEVDPRTLFISLPDDIEVESDYFGCGHKKCAQQKENGAPGTVGPENWTRDALINRRACSVISFAHSFRISRAEFSPGSAMFDVATRCWPFELAMRRHR